MKKIISFCFCCAFLSTSFAQKESYDLATYTVPKGWKKDTPQNSVIAYTTTNNRKKIWCRIAVYKSTGSKGSIEQDFDSEWQSLVAAPYKITEAPQVTLLPGVKEWKIYRRLFFSQRLAI